MLSQPARALHSPRGKRPGRGGTPSCSSTNPAPDCPPRRRRRIQGPQARIARASPRLSGEPGSCGNARLPSPPRRPRGLPARVCLSPASRPSTPRLGCRRVRGPPTPHNPRLFLLQPGIPLRCPRSRPRRRLRIRDFTSGESKRERKVCPAPAPAGEPARRTATASHSQLADASCSARACQLRARRSRRYPAPVRPRRRRRRRRLCLSLRSDEAAARLPPRSECCPARARGAHTLTLAGVHSHTRTHASEGSAAAAAARAGSGGRRGARGRGAGPPGGAPANNVGEQPPPASKVFTPGKKKVKRNRPGTGESREHQRVGTREPEKAKQRQRES